MSTHATASPPSCPPIIKWTGGKRLLVPLIAAGRPRDADSYCEPFLGAGAVFLGLDIEPARCTLGDLNPDLFTVHTAVRDHCEELLEVLIELEGATTGSEEEYYTMRDSTPSEPVERAVRILYLLQHSFRGLYRVNKGGRFNVAWDSSSAGRSLQPVIDAIPAASRRLQGTDMVNDSAAETVLEHLTGPRTGRSPWVYLDPPYVSTFEGYTAAGFGQDEHQQLVNDIAEWTAHGVAVMVSNSNCPATIDLYGEHLTMFEVPVRQACGTAGSRVTSEVIGINYPLADMVDPTRFLETATPLSEPRDRRASAPS